MHLQGQVSRTGGLSVWISTIVIIVGVLLTLAGLHRYRQTRAQLEAGTFEPAGFLIDLVGLLIGLLGLALAGYLLSIGRSF